jgi:hypothetical protein
MSGRAGALSVVVAIALAMPAVAQGPMPPTTAFDGHYAGASAHTEKHTSHQGPCPPHHTPDALTISNGVVHSGTRDRWTGTVNPQGHVVLRNKRAMRVDAQIDPQGTVSGRYQGPACSVDFVWQKQPQ